MAKNIFLRNHKKEIFCIIPARGGSKGISNKNIVKIKNKELINYTIQTALKLKKHCDIVISTDSKKILLTNVVDARIFGGLVIETSTNVVNINIKDRLKTILNYLY